LEAVELLSTLKTKHRDLILDSKPIAQIDAASKTARSDLVSLLTLRSQGRCALKLNGEPLCRHLDF